MHDSRHQVLPTGRLSRPCTIRFLHPLFFPVPHGRHPEVLDSPWKSDFQGTGHINGKDVCGEYPFPDNHKTIPVAALLFRFSRAEVFSELLLPGLLDLYSSEFCRLSDRFQTIPSKYLCPWWKQR